MSKRGKTALVLATALALAGCGARGTAQPVRPQPGKASGPLAGLNVYICDEEGNRILEVNGAKKVLWTAHVPAPDDCAPSPHGNLIVNSDVHQIVYEVSRKTGKIVWTYGQMNQAGPAPNQLGIPEDSFPMPGGRVAITDPGNQRVIQVDKATHRVVWQYGHTGVPGMILGYVTHTNDGVPLKNGDTLITESGSKRMGLLPTVLEVNPQHQIVWSVTLPQLQYASDAMPIGHGEYVVTNWVQGGSIDVFNRQGQILWSYGPQSGPGKLNHPSSAERLPNGNYLVSDDYNDRVVVIDPHTNRIVWQYGTTGVSGSGPNHLVGPTDAKAAGEPLPPYVQAVGQMKG